MEINGFIILVHCLNDDGGNGEHEEFLNTDIDEIL